MRQREGCTRSRGRASEVGSEVGRTDGRRDLASRPFPSLAGCGSAVTGPSPAYTPSDRHIQPELDHLVLVCKFETKRSSRCRGMATDRTRKEEERGQLTWVDPAPCSTPSIPTAPPSADGGEPSPPEPNMAASARKSSALPEKAGDASRGAAVGGRGDRGTSGFRSRLRDDILGTG